MQLTNRLIGVSGLTDLDSQKSTLSQIHRIYEFNLSHCDGLILCGVTVGCQIGVDCENIDRNVEIERLAPRVFAAKETDNSFNFLSSSPPSPSSTQRTPSLFLLQTGGLSSPLL